MGLLIAGLVLAPFIVGAGVLDWRARRRRARVGTRVIDYRAPDRKPEVRYDSPDNG